MKRRIALAMLLVLGVAFVGPTPASAVPEVPDITIDKTVTADYYTPGDTITFKYVVTGNDRFDNLVVSDDKCSPVEPVLAGDGYNVGDLYGTKGIFNGLAGDAWEYTCETTAPAAGAGGVNSTNTATVSGTSPWPVWAELNPFTDTDTFTLERWVLRKHVVFYWDFVNEIVDPGAANVEFDVNLYKGTTALNRVLVGTEQVSPAQELFVWLTPGNWRMTEGTPPTGYTTLRGDWVIGDVPDAPGAPYPDNTFFNTMLFDLAIAKTGPAFALAGGSVTYGYTVTNAGPRAVTPVVTDNKCSPVTSVPQVGDPAHNIGDVNDNGKIESTETWQFTCTYTPSWTFPSPLTNTATVADAMRPTGAPWNLAQLMGGDTNAANNTASFTLGPYEIFKDVVEWGTGNQLVDPTTFTVTIKQGSTVVGTVQIKEGDSAQFWLAAGTYTFCETVLPFYIPNFECWTQNVATTTPVPDYPAWTVVNSRWYGFSHGYYKNQGSRIGWQSLTPPVAGAFMATAMIDGTEALGTFIAFDVPTSLTIDGVWIGNKTLLQALSFQGGPDPSGKAQILLKQAVAALLNESRFGASFGDFTLAQLQANVNAALAGSESDMTDLASELDYWNNGIVV